MSTASRGVRLTAVERKRIQLDAPSHSVASLSRLIGRDAHTVTAWAQANGVTFGITRRKPSRRVSHKALPMDSSDRVEKMIALAFRSAA